MPRSLKPHIGIFGRRNVGKSALINALCGHDISIVSSEAGTTTDPVKKNIEVPGIGPTVFVDTAGIDDVGSLGEKRIERTRKIYAQVDLGLLVFDGRMLGDYEKEILDTLNEKNVPTVVVHNKCDLAPLDAAVAKEIHTGFNVDVTDFSAAEKMHLEELVERIRTNLPTSSYNRPSILGDLVRYGDVVLLITPIDIEAPEGRIILPQVQTIRDVLDNDCVVLMMKEREVDVFFRKHDLTPALAVTDSQIFLKAAAQVPDGVPLTSFSILFARLKGDFDAFIRGTRAIGTLKDGDRVLILESCTHHVSGDDIGRVKIPRWMTAHTGKKLAFDVVAGLGKIDRPIESYSLVVQCGGCMLTRKQLINRVVPAVEKGVPVTNYGMAIAFCHGIFERAVAPFIGASESVDYL